MNTDRAENIEISILRDDKPALSLLIRQASPHVLGQWLLRAISERREHALAALAALAALIAAGAPLDEMDANGWTPAMRAVHEDSPACLRQLIDAGCAIDAFTPGSGWTAATFAATRGRPECLALLIQAGCAIDPRLGDGWTPAMQAASGGAPGCLDCLRLLIDAGCDLDATANDGVGLRALARPACAQAIDEAKARREAALISSHLATPDASACAPRL